MYSTHDNLDNPLRIPDYLNMQPRIESIKCPIILHVSQEQYDLMKHDPHTIYYIINAKKCTVYYGDQKIPQIQNDCRYLMGPRDPDGYYHLYMVIYNDGRSDIVDVCKCADLKSTLQLLHEWDRSGYNYDSRGVIRQAILSYIIQVNNCNEFIINVISMFGYREDPRLQDVIQWMATMGSNTFSYKAPNFVEEQIEYLRKHPHNSLFNKYADLYNLLVKYGFFRGKEYQSDDVDPDEIKLDEPIDEIINIMKK